MLSLVPVDESPFLAECIVTHGETLGRQTCEEIELEIAFGFDRVCRHCRRETIQTRCPGCGRRVGLK